MSSAQTPEQGSHTDDLSPIAHSPMETTLRRIRYPLFIMSGKGGVGKSAVTANLAVALANKGYKVGILDVDIHGPSIPSLLGIQDRMESAGGKMLAPVLYKNNVEVVSMDTLLENRDSAIIWRGPKKTSAIRQFVAGVTWGNLDFLLIDSPPGTGDEHLAVLQAIPHAQCIMVTTPQEISLADVRKALDFLKKVNANLLGMVENMSGLSCPHCGGHIDLFSSGGGEELARTRGIPFLGRLPLDPAMLVAADRNIPVVDLEEESAAKKSFEDLASAVETALAL